VTKISTSAPAEVTASGWTDSQVRLFAKRIAESPEGKAWWAFPAVIRDAILSHHVLMNVFLQRSSEISVDDLRELIVLIERRLASHHGLKTQA